MRPSLFLLLLPTLLACGERGRDRGEAARDEEEYALPVRVESPGRATVVDTVETQATLTTDVHIDVYAEVNGRIVAKERDLGDRVGEGRNGDDPLLLARIDDRDLRLALKEAEITLKEKEGRIRELELERQRARGELDQAVVAVKEAEAVHGRTSEGIKDGTISMEEHERGTFALRIAEKKLAAAQAALDKAEVALELGAVAIEQAAAARDRAELALEHAAIVSPIAGVVTRCEVQPGERVKVGDLLYRVEDPDSLVLYADVPVRQATRVSVDDEVRIRSTAVPEPTEGRVVLVAPTVDEASGTVRVKIAVEPRQGYKPGLFVTLRIVVATREDALVVPKRALLHDDEEGPYLFAVRDDRAERVLVDTGFEGDGVVEVAAGLDESAAVIVEGQDTVADGARVEVLAAAPDER